MLLVFGGRALSTERIVKLENFPLIFTQTVTTTPTETVTKKIGRKKASDDDDQMMNSNFPPIRVIDTLHIISVCFV